MHLQVQILFGMAYYKKRGPLSKLFYCKNLLLLKVWIPLVGTYTIYNFLKKKICTLREWNGEMMLGDQRSFSKQGYLFKTESSS